MNKERLLRLADHLDKVKPEKFDITHWVTNEINPDLVLKSTKEDRELSIEGFCGTVACVLGHAAFIPEFRKAGLTVYNEALDPSVGFCGTIVYNPDQVRINRIDDLEEFPTDGLAGEAFFELTSNQAYYLFGLVDRAAEFYGREELEQVTSKDAARTIRQFAETDGKSLEDFLDARFGADRNDEE